MKKLITLSSLMLLSATGLYAQESTKKLKDVQANNLFAPSAVKIDGNTTEWKDEFQAYNKSNQLYYTLANDENNLYLVFKTSDLTTSSKIAAGGITVSINTAGQQKSQDTYQLTFPLRTNMAPPSGGFGGGNGGSGFGGNAGGGGNGGGRNTGPDSAVLKARHDHVVNSAKEIKIFGFKGIPDSLIAIYNEYNIKAAISYDKSNAFIYELAVPLKLIGMTAGDTKEIAYNIKLNGLQMNFKMPEGATPPQGGNGNWGGGGQGGGTNSGGGGRNSVNFQDMITPSDFWGKYTLAKK